jgi:probable HAF family extracellular repeat protein
LAAVITACISLVTTDAAFGAMMFGGLGIPPGASSSFASAISADGSVIVGSTYDQFSELMTSVRWTRNGAIELLPPLPQYASSYATGVSADGSVVIGTSGKYGEERAFRWTLAGGTQDLGVLPGHGRSDAVAVSGDGSVIVGSSSSYNNIYDNRAVRWTTAGGIQDLGTLRESEPSGATAISGDGSVVAGWSGSGAFRWTLLGGMRAMDVLPTTCDAGTSSYPGDDGDTGFSSCGYVPVAMSGDGSVIVGRIDTHQPSAGGIYQAFRWAAGSGFKSLGVIPGPDPLAVSADGSIALVDGIVWDEFHGTRGLRDFLAIDHGLHLDGWTLEGATGISADGLTIVGNGINPSGQYEAWMAVIPEPTVLPLLAMAGSALLRRPHPRPLPTLN